MHTSHYTIEGYGHVIVHHNGDWSGDAVVQWDPRSPQEVPGVVEFDNVVTIPAPLLIALSKKAAKDAVIAHVIAAIETME